MFKRKLVTLFKKVHPKFGLRDSDIMLASYPKSGNTWVRFIWLNMVSLKELKGKEIDFNFANGPLNAEYDSHSYGSIDYDCLPRLVKTHKNYDQRFFDNRSVYLVRNPGDVMISYFEYVKGQTNYENQYQNISEFIRSEKYGIHNWCRHVKSWENNYDIILTYEELKDDTASHIWQVIKHFDLNNIDKATVIEAVRRSSFENMRKVENKKGRPGIKEGKFKKDHKFTRSGTVGQWKDRLNEEDISYLEDTINDYGLNNYLKSIV